VLQGSSICVKLFTFVTKHFSGQADLELLCAHLLRIWLLCTCVMHGTSVYDNLYMCKDNLNRQHVLYHITTSGARELPKEHATELRSCGIKKITRSGNALQNREPLLFYTFTLSIFAQL